MGVYKRSGDLPGIASLLRNQEPAVYQDSSYQRIPLVMNTPQKRQIGSVDVYPNLLVTTLAVVAVSLPPGKPYSESAPQQKRVLVVDHVRPITLGINPSPQAVQWSQSAPPPKAPVYVLAQPNYLPLGINPNPQSRQVSDSAPPRKYAVTVDPQPNLSVTTLFPVAAQAPFVPVDFSQTQRKYEVFADVPGRPLTLGINPNPRATSWSDSAPPPKYQVQVDVYPNQQTTLFFVAPTFPAGTIYTESATTNAQKFQIQVDVPANFTSVIPATIIPLAPTIPPEQSAGRRTRSIYRVTVDGHKFEFKSYFDAIAFLDKTKTAAEALARQAVRKALDAKDVQKPTFEHPKIIVSSRDLRGAVTETKRAISQIYDAATRDVEIAILIELDRRKAQDEDDTIFWLM